jgi:hypothetical protein
LISEDDAEAKMEGLQEEEDKLSSEIAKEAENLDDVADEPQDENTELRWQFTRETEFPLPSLYNIYSAPSHHYDTGKKKAGAKKGQPQMTGGREAYAVPERVPSSRNPCHAVAKFAPPDQIVQTIGMVALGFDDWEPAIQESQCRLHYRKQSKGQQFYGRSVGQFRYDGDDFETIEQKVKSDVEKR